MRHNPVSSLGQFTLFKMLLLPDTHLRVCVCVRPCQRCDPCGCGHSRHRPGPVCERRRLVRRYSRVQPHHHGGKQTNTAVPLILPGTSWRTAEQDIWKQVYILIHIRAAMKYGAQDKFWWFWWRSIGRSDPSGETYVMFRSNPTSGGDIWPEWHLNPLDSLLAW